MSFRKQVRDFFGAADGTAKAKTVSFDRDLNPLKKWEPFHDINPNEKQQKVRKVKAEAKRKRKQAARLRWLMHHSRSKFRRELHAR